jgi:hypothetical protein
MKTRLYFLVIAVFFLTFCNFLNAQNSGLSVRLTKSNGNIFSINNAGKHLLSLEVTGIENAKHAENLMKFIRNYRGVEEFNLIPVTGENKWKAEGVFYEYSDIAYFKNLFKLMKVTEVVQDNIKTSIDNL